MDNSNEIAARTQALAQRIAGRWQGTSSGTGPTLTAVNTTSMVQRIQRSVSRAGVIHPRVERLPVISMNRYATRHVARFPEPTAHLEPRAMTLPDAPALPLVGEPTAVEPLPDTPAPATSGAAPVPAAPDEEPEWLKRLPSFEEATAQLRFPDSVNVKLPERTQRQPPSHPPAEPPTAPPRTKQPPVIARKPQAPEPPPGPRRMRVMTQVEEFTPGRRPPPVSLSDLRRVRVGEPQPSRKQDETVREPAPAEEGEPSAIQRAPQEAAEAAAPEPSESPPVRESDKTRQDDTAERPSTAEKSAVKSAQRPAPAKRSRPPAIQRVPADAPAPAPPKPRVTTDKPDIGLSAEEPAVEPLVPEAESKPSPAESEAPELQRTPTEASPEPPAPTAVGETQESEEASTQPTDMPARRPPVSRSAKPPTIQRASTKAVEPTPPAPPNTRAAPAREKADAPSVAAPVRQDSVSEGAEPLPLQPPTEAPSAVEDEQAVSKPPERTIAQAAQVEKGADVSPKPEGTPTTLQRAPAEPVEPVSAEPAAETEAPTPKHEASELSKPPTEASSTDESEPPALQRAPAEATQLETQLPSAKIAPLQDATERTPEKPRVDTVRPPIPAEGHTLQRAPADVTESESPADRVIPSADVPGSDKPTPVVEDAPPLMQRKPTETPVAARGQRPTPTRKEEPAPVEESGPVTTEAGAPPAVQRAATEQPPALEPTELPADAPAPQARVSKSEEAQRDQTAGIPSTPEKRAQVGAQIEEGAPPAVQRAATEAPAPEPTEPPADASTLHPPVPKGDEARRDERAGIPSTPEKHAQVEESKPVMPDVGRPPEIQRALKEASAPELPAPPARPAAPAQPPSVEVEEALPIAEDAGKPPVLQRAPADASAPEPAKSPARAVSQPAAVPAGDEVPSPVEDEPPPVQRASAEPPAPESPSITAEQSTPPALQRTPTEATAPGLPATLASAPVLDDVPRVDLPEEPTTTEEDTVEHDQSLSLVEKVAPVAREHLAVDTGLVQRLTARAEVAVQRMPEGGPIDAPVAQAPPPSTSEPTFDEQLSLPADALAADALTADAHPISPAWTPVTPPAPVTRPTLPPRDVDAPLRGPDRRPRSLAPIELPLAPRTAVVQRKALHAETKVAEAPDQWIAPEATVNMHARAPMTSVPTYLQRATAGEAMTETRTLEEPLETPTEPLELLDESDMALLARDVLPIVKRLLQTELERHIQSDLEW